MRLALVSHHALCLFFAFRTFRACTTCCIVNVAFQCCMILDVPFMMHGLLFVSACLIAAVNDQHSQAHSSTST